MALVLGVSDHGKVCVGDDVVIQVIMLPNERVKLAIQAPRDVPVMRAELLKDWELSMIEAAALEPKRRK